MRFSLVAVLCVVLALVAGCYQSHDIGSDAGPRPDAGPRLDAGAGVRCDEETLPEPVGPACSDAVSACRHACAPADDACRDACLDAPCRACFYGTIFHCANAAGCESLWRGFACCIESVPTCSDLRGFDRVRCAPQCPMQFEPYASCIENTGGMACFMRAALVCNLR